MKLSTKKFLMDLEHTDWFNNSGKIVAETTEIQAVHGWSQAMAIAAAETTEHAHGEALSELTVWLSAHHYERYQSWNSMIKELKPSIAHIISEKLSSAAIRKRLPIGSEQFFLKTLRWDLLGISMAHEYQDLIVTRYYDLMAHWYLAGHFPCGWIGEVPENMENAFHTGKLAVF